MATLQERVSLLATRVGQECQAIYGQIGTLTELPEAQRASLVAAIKNINSSLATLTSSVGTNSTNIGTLQSDVDQVEADLKALQDQVAAATNINDAAVSTTTTYSSSKITSEITAAKQAVKDDLLNGAGEAYDTLKELQTAIEANKDLIEAFEEVAAGHVAFDKAQSLTDTQKGQARTNIGAAAAADLTALDTRVGTAEGKITTVEGKVSTLEGKMTTVEGKVTTLEGEMDDVQALAETNESAIAGHATRLTAVENKATTNANNVTSLTSRVSAVETMATNNATAISDLAEAVGNTDTDFVAAFETAMNA